MCSSTYVVALLVLAWQSQTAWHSCLHGHSFIRACMESMNLFVVACNACMYKCTCVLRLGITFAMWLPCHEEWPITIGDILWQVLRLPVSIYFGKYTGGGDESQDTCHTPEAHCHRETKKHCLFVCLFGCLFVCLFVCSPPFRLGLSEFNLRSTSPSSPHLTREAPSSRRTTFYFVSQNKVEQKGQRARHRRTNDKKKPSDRITHAGTIQISRLSKPPNLRCINLSCLVFKHVDWPLKRSGSNHTPAAVSPSLFRGATPSMR